MGFVDRLRMNNLYPNIGLEPPDFNGGIDIRKLLMMQQAPPPIPPPIPAPALPRIANQYRDMNKPMDVVLGPNALSQARIGLEPDKGDIFANNPKYALQAQALAQKNELSQDRLALDRDKLTSSTNLGQQRVDVSKQRAAIYDFKAKNPGLQFKVSQGGNFIAFNPVTGENFDTGVSSGTMSEEDRINITGQQRLDQIRATGENQMNTQELRGNQRLTEIGANIQGRKDIANMAPDRPELPTQTRVRQANAARELFNTDPELAKFVDVKPDGSFEITPPSTSFWGSPKGPTMDQFNKIKEKIYGTGTAAKTITNQPSTAAPTSIPQVPAGRVAITKDGKTFSVPESQLNDALKQGYTKVGDKK